MEAAKRMYDNSYDQRLETAALAKAYLEQKKVEEDSSLAREEKQIRAGKVCSAMAVVISLVYCLALFALILLPLIKETNIQKVNIANSSHQKEIATLSKEIYQLEEKLKISALMEIEEIAITDLKMVKRDDSIQRPYIHVPYISLEEAKKAYYETKIDYMSKGE